MTDSMIFKSDFLINNNNIEDECIKAERRIRDYLGNASTTWSYDKYNVFSVVSCNEFFYSLYKEIKNVLNHIYGEKPLWIDAWLNAHSYNDFGYGVCKELDWHSHSFETHGYISLVPKNTKTLFEDYTITNEVGNIYIGNGKLKHRVVSEKPYEGTRYTLAFNVYDTLDYIPENKTVIPV